MSQIMSHKVVHTYYSELRRGVNAKKVISFEIEKVIEKVQMAYVVLEGVGQGTTIWLLYVFLKRFCLFIYFFKRFYSFIMRDTERQRHRQREEQAPCRKPDVGLDPRTPGS